VAGLLTLILVGGCATAFRSGRGFPARSSSEADQPAIVQATVPFAILLVIGLVISRTFKND
jgi:hypothetical protein